MRVTLFKLKKPKRFAYLPRHYDPVKEDLHSRVAMIKSDLEGSASMSRDRIRQAWKTPESRKSANRTSTFRIALIALILFAFFYVYFFTQIFS